MLHIAKILAMCPLISQFIIHHILVFMLLCDNKSVNLHRKTSVLTNLDENDLSRLWILWNLI